MRDPFQGGLVRGYARDAKNNESDVALTIKRLMQHFARVYCFTTFLHHSKLILPGKLYKGSRKRGHQKSRRETFERKMISFGRKPIILQRQIWVLNTLMLAGMRELLLFSKRKHVSHRGKNQFLRKEHVFIFCATHFREDWFMAMHGTLKIMNPMLLS